MLSRRNIHDSATLQPGWVADCDGCADGPWFEDEFCPEGDFPMWTPPLMGYRDDGFNAFSDHNKEKKKTWWRMGIWSKHKEEPEDCAPPEPAAPHANVRTRLFKKHDKQESCPDCDP
jgi:hypothetical protein